MTTANDRREAALKENTEKLWEIFNTYFNDPDGVTREEAIELAEFNKAEDHDSDVIFDRALRVCRKRAEKAGMFIPRATLARNRRGYAYVLTDRGDLVVDGFIAQQRVSTGTLRSTHKHQKFIVQDISSLSPMERLMVEELAQLNDEVEKVRNESIDTRVEQLEKVRNAWLEEQFMATQSE